MATVAVIAALPSAALPNAAGAMPAGDDGWHGDYSYICCRHLAGRGLRPGIRAAAVQHPGRLPAGVGLCGPLIG